MSKRSNDGLALLSSNAMLQMAGRAGRRGIDDQGHVVVVQTPFEGAEDFCEVLFAGPEPLVSQFTTTYGMVLNLLAVRFLSLGGGVPYILTSSVYSCMLFLMMISMTAVYLFPNNTKHCTTRPQKDRLWVIYTRADVTETRPICVMFF